MYMTNELSMESLPKRLRAKAPTWCQVYSRFRVQAACDLSWCWVFHEFRPEQKKVKTNHS